MSDVVCISGALIPSQVYVVRIVGRVFATARCSE